MGLHKWVNDYVIRYGKRWQLYRLLEKINVNAGTDKPPKYEWIQAMDRDRPITHLPVRPKRGVA